jgi:hypothetical protein
MSLVSDGMDVGSKNKLVTGAIRPDLPDLVIHDEAQPDGEDLRRVVKRLNVVLRRRTSDCAWTRVMTRPLGEPRGRVATHQDSVRFWGTICTASSRPRSVSTPAVAIW